MNKLEEHWVTSESISLVNLSGLALPLFHTQLLIVISGSYRAQAYAKAFPNKVGNFVLDAVVPQGLVRDSFLVLFARLI